MNNETENLNSGLFNGRLLAVLGIIVVAFGIFLENWDVARLSSLKASLTQMETERTRKYTAEKPDYPVREVDFLIPPRPVAYNATDAEKAAFAEAKSQYDTSRAELVKQFENDLKKYNDEQREYQKKTQEFKKQKALSEKEYQKKRREVKESIEDKEIAINKMWFPLILRFLGSLIFLGGALFILKNASQYEKVGVLILIGFAFKTIIGL
ncbi:MAG: hypothetical protein LDLANPLL_00964 [Turneriella sp.]|nr:hypothetical protein [Turneriella sp.]